MNDPREQLAALEARMIADTIWIRAEFFRRFPTNTTAEIVALAGRAEGADCSVERWQLEGRIFSVNRSAERFYPAFQFDQEMRPLPIIGEILAILRQYTARTDWDNALWFAAPNGWLDGPSPIELLLTEPDLVKDAAEQEVLPHIE